MKNFLLYVCCLYSLSFSKALLADCPPGATMQCVNENRSQCGNQSVWSCKFNPMTHQQQCGYNNVYSCHNVMTPVCTCHGNPTAPGTVGDYRCSACDASKQFCGIFVDSTQRWASGQWLACQMPGVTPDDGL